MPSVNQLKVKIFADGADKAGMLDMYRNPHVKGFTTNPTLMRKAGVTDYEAAARDIVKAIPDRSISFEVFAGRIADTGIDPVPIMAESVKRLRAAPNTELIWASPRELLNIFQADEIGCQVITVTNDIIKKLSLVGKDMNEYSLETVKMFYDDGKAAGYKL